MINIVGWLPSIHSPLLLQKAPRFSLQKVPSHYQWCSLGGFDLIPNSRDGPDGVTLIGSPVSLVTEIGSALISIPPNLGQWDTSRQLQGLLGNQLSLPWHPQRRLPSGCCSVDTKSITAEIWRAGWTRELQEPHGILSRWVKVHPHPGLPLDCQ